MIAPLTTLTEELSWVFSSNKFSKTRRQNDDYWTLLYPFPIAAFILVLRHLLLRYCFAPCGVYFGVKNSKSRLPPPNPVLETAYVKWKPITGPQIVGLAKQLDMSQRQVERWMRQKQRQNRPSALIKFTECCWRCTYYTSLFFYGLVVLWNKPWFWDIKLCWTDYTNQVVTTDIWVYYMVSLAFYWSLFFGQFFVDTKRRDFWQMFIHHIAAILLITFSWLSGASRIGSLVLMIHDAGDIFLEASKLAKYANFHATSIGLFCAFVVLWISTRMGIFPLWIVKHTLFDIQACNPNFKAYYTFNALLLTLEMLHCFWTYLILKGTFILLTKGTLERDVRSSSDEVSE